MSRQIATLSPPINLRRSNGDIVKAVATGYDDELNSSGFLVAYDSPSQGGPFWINDEDVVEHWTTANPSLDADQ
jgi:hypothetical protein